MVKRKPKAKAQATSKDGCDIKFTEKDATPDHELPVAVGGVEFADDGEGLDGCDVPMNHTGLTPDTHLPAAKGGIASNA